MEPNIILIDTENERMSDLKDLLEFLIENKGSVIDTRVEGAYVMIYASDEPLSQRKKIELFEELLQTEEDEQIGGDAEDEE